jgi:hypothetical protein
MLVVAPSAPTKAIARQKSLLARHQVYTDTVHIMIELARQDR